MSYEWQHTLSTATSARSHIQTIGRVIRPAPGKTAMQSYINSGEYEP